MNFKHLKKAVTAVAVLALGLTTVLAGCGKQNDTSVKKIQDKKELVVGTSADFAPYDFTIVKNGKQKIVGYDMLLANDIAKEMGVKKVKVVNMAFPSLINELQNKKVDIVMAGMAYTKDRAKVVSFSDPYEPHTSKYDYILVSPKNKDKYKNLAALKGQTLGAQQSTAQEKAAKNQSKAKVVTESSLNTLSQELKNGTIDGIVCSYDNAKAYESEDPSSFAIASNVKFKQGGKEAATRVAVRKDDKALLKKVNAAISKDRKSGKLNKLYQQALKLQIENKK
ncbi:ABC transporter substrate-binding protein [Limosilactobacillus secaliphilus]|uniref:Amino acid ABC transporter n=1 Tax=Limosilactobacillus secaliphilus TaxID=396268 RepID=A0A0R2I769_9LACO|nr:ABC transporter substrate-binding protein [Limosilactobacillus secaliphilus]KRN58389.1 amino acid ABC transporter [Limosilactobacillus secaliphilus]